MTWVDTWAGSSLFTTVAIPDWRERMRHKLKQSPAGKTKCSGCEFEPTLIDLFCENCSQITDHGLRIREGDEEIKQEEDELLKNENDVEIEDEDDEEMEYEDDEEIENEDDEETDYEAYMRFMNLHCECAQKKCKREDQRPGLNNQP